MYNILFIYFTFSFFLAILYGLYVLKFDSISTLNGLIVPLVTRAKERVKAKVHEKKSGKSIKIKSRV